MDEILVNSKVNKFLQRYPDHDFQVTEEIDVIIIEAKRLPIAKPKPDHDYKQATI